MSYTHNFLVAEIKIEAIAMQLIAAMQKLLTFLAHLDKVQGPGHVAQSIGHLTRKSGVLGSIPGHATYFRFSFRFFTKGSCQLLVKVWAQSTG